MGNAVKKLVKLRKEVVEAEKKVVGEKIQTAYEENRRNAEKVFKICMDALIEKAKDPYSESIEEEFDSVSASDFWAQLYYFENHLAFLPNCEDIYAFGYVYEIDKSKRSKLSKIYFDLKYFKELVALNSGLLFEKPDDYRFSLKVKQKLPVVDEECIKSLGLRQ